MGKIEKHSKARAKKENLKKAILAALYGAGIVSIALLAPNVLGALGKMGIVRKNKEYSVRRSLDGLLRKKLVVFKATPTGKFIRLTPQGERALQQMGGGESQKPRWDGKWRIVVYDLREHKRALREKLRRSLVLFGFSRLQDSVWVYPYDCEDFITLMKADFKIGKEILYVIADSIENDHVLRARFGIS